MFPETIRNKFLTLLKYLYHLTQFIFSRADVHQNITHFFQPLIKHIRAQFWCFSFTAQDHLSGNVPQVNGMSLSIGQIIAISITATAASIGAAGIPQVNKRI